MNPKWHPVALPIDCAPFGEHPFQPYLIKGHALVVAGGPSALFLITATHVPEFALTIQARVRISGFAVHGSMLYVQDGPVLSRWNIVDLQCSAAINVVVPTQRYSRGTQEPDWDALHKLPNEAPTYKADKQRKLQVERRKVEWLRMLEAVEKQLTTPGATRTTEETARLEQLGADLRLLVGLAYDELRKDLATAETEAAELIISTPVVREHQLGGKAKAMVFVLGRNGAIHPLDAQLSYMGTANFDRNVRPSLAMAELGDGISDQYACRLYYVTEAGKVRCIDGDSQPLKSLHEWPARGRASLEPGVRARVEGDLVWGNNAQGSGIFALPIEPPGAASLVNVPLSDEWRWLEIRPEQSLALVATDRSCRLVSYAPKTNLADRFAVKPDRAPYFSSFLKGDSKRPLLVAEFERDANRGDKGVVFRLLPANDADVTVPPPAEHYAGIYPPLPTSVLEDQLAGSDEIGPPVRLRTQPTISEQDAYIMARDKTIQQQLNDLTVSGWKEHLTKIEQQYGSRADASAKLGEIALPSLSGRDALYCFAIGSVVTDAIGRRAFEVLNAMRELAKPPVRLQIVETIYRVYGSRILKESTEPIRNRTVTLIYEDDGSKFGMTTNADGRVLLAQRAHGRFVSMVPFGPSSFLPPFVTRAFCTREADNKIELSVYKKIGE